MNSHSNTDIAAKYIRVCIHVHLCTKILSCIYRAPEGGERQWLDGEVERILQQKQTLQMLEKVPKI